LNTTNDATDETLPDLTGSTLLSTLNDGTGVRIAAAGTNDFQITLTDGKSFDGQSDRRQHAFRIVFKRHRQRGDGRRPLGKNHREHRYSRGKLDRPHRLGRCGGSVSVTPLNGSVCGIRPRPLPKRHDPGQRLDPHRHAYRRVTADIQVTMMSGAKVDIDLSNLDTGAGCALAFNSAELEPVFATINSTGTGINLTDTAGGSGSLTVVNMNGSLAGTNLGLNGRHHGILPPGPFRVRTSSPGPRRSMVVT